MNRFIFVILFLLLVVLALPAIADNGEETRSTGKYLAVFGANFLGSFLIGKIQKKIVPKRRRDMIPATSPTVCGGTTLAVTGGDPVSALLGVGASLLTTFIHQTAKRYS